MKIEYIQALMSVYKEFECLYQEDGMAGMIIDLKLWLAEQGEMFCFPIDLSVNIKSLDIKYGDKILLIHSHEDMSSCVALGNYIMTHLDLDFLQSMPCTKHADSSLLFIFRSGSSC